MNTIAMDATQMIVAADTTRLDGCGSSESTDTAVAYLSNRPAGFVTVIVDLTPVLDAPAPPGRST